MPTDDKVDGLFALASKDGREEDGSPREHSAGIEWGELHMPAEFRR